MEKIRIRIMPKLINCNPFHPAFDAGANPVEAFIGQTTWTLRNRAAFLNFFCGMIYFGQGKAIAKLIADNVAFDFSWIKEEKYLDYITQCLCQLNHPNSEFFENFAEVDTIVRSWLMKL